MNLSKKKLKHRWGSLFTETEQIFFFNDSTIYE